MTWITDTAQALAEALSGKFAHAGAVVAAAALDTDDSAIAFASPPGAPVVCDCGAEPNPGVRCGPGQDAASGSRALSDPSRHFALNPDADLGPSAPSDAGVLSGPDSDVRSVAPSSDAHSGPSAHSDTRTDARFVPGTCSESGVHMRAGTRAQSGIRSGASVHDVRSVNAGPSVQSERGAQGESGGSLDRGARLDRSAHPESGAEPESGVDLCTARFEIGSVTKTMTAAMIALSAVRGRLALDDPIGRWLDAGPNAELTVRELATHNSGLPAVGPSRMNAAASAADPWAGYGFAEAERDLRAVTIAPGHPHRYSNLGYQLLGLILERADGRSFAQLLSEELFEPLGMTRSTVGIVGPKAGVTVGGVGVGAGTDAGIDVGASASASAGGTGPYRGRLRGEAVTLGGRGEAGAVPRWAQPLGAGGVEATIADLARYARACLRPPDSELGRALRLTQTPLVPIDGQTSQALGWVVRVDGSFEHSGGTGGFSADLTISPRRSRAVVLLVNFGGSPAHSTYLKEAADLAIRDRDPRTASGPTPWPNWREDALHVVALLFEGRFAHVHARMAAPVRAKVSAAQLETGWTRRTDDGGAAGSVTVARHEIAASGAVVADLACDFAAGRRLLRVLILPTGELGGLTFLPLVG